MTEILKWLESEGFSEINDSDLYEYLETWLFNNQFMVMKNPVELFQVSRGYVEYKATGHVTPDED